MENIWLWIIGAYFAGSIPFGLIFTKIFGLGDIRAFGSGNIGATNVLRTGHKGLAIATLIADAFKGMVPLLLAKKYNYSEHAICLIAFTAVLGHVFPLWLRFKGGKGVSTTLGVNLVVVPWLCALQLAIWLMMAKIFKISSLAALISMSLSTVIAWFMWGWVDITKLQCLLTMLLLWTHRANILRLLKGEEGKITLA